LSDVVAETFENMHNFQFDFAVSFIYKKENYTPTGTVMGSSVPPLEFKNIRTPDLEPFICTPKTMTSAYYEVDGSSEDLLVLNIHGMNFTKISSFKRQVLSAVEVIQAHDGPVIFAGDFNSHGKRRKKWLKKILGLVGMHDIGFRNDKRKKFVVGELDYFFVKDLAVKDAWTEKNKSSDHAAMFAELQLAN
jgi:endonuclease/exonuclease/phosphatase (EEP) superfamily protein YafD